MKNKNNDLNALILARIQDMHTVKEQLPGKFENTWIELSLQRQLTAQGIDHYTQVPLVGLPDLFIAPNICIFADGCYYHACKKCGFGNKFPGKRTKDAFNTRKLEEHGFVVFRFWEHDIKNDPQKCIKKILAYARNNMSV